MPSVTLLGLDRTDLNHTTFIELCRNHDVNERQPDFYHSLTSIYYSIQSITLESIDW